MKLILKNIGMLKEAELTLHPLSVIAGENDNGKSTVGKIMFCIIKAVNLYKEESRRTKESWLANHLHKIFFLLRTGIVVENENQADHLNIIKTATEKNRIEIWNWPVYHERITLLLNESAPHVKPGLHEEVKQLIEKINSFIDQPDVEKQLIENTLTKVFTSEFDSSLLLHGAIKGEIKLFEKDIVLLSLTIEHDRKIFLHNEVEPIELKDVTFIESPLILNHHSLLQGSQTLLDIDPKNVSEIGLPYTTLHTKDLFDKLRRPIMPASIFDDDKISQHNRFSSIIKGEVRHDKSSNDFVFTREQQDISIKNTASGIKAFGLLHILLANDIIGKNTMLIFDEPENHLHPKWQLVLAELLVELSKSGVYVLLSSHSPYMIEALKRYAERAQLDDQHAFYLAEERCIRDEDRLAEIFRVLSEPFEVFRQMDAEDMASE